MRAATEAMKTLLRLDHSLDLVEIGFEDDDDIFVSIDLHPRVVDVQELKAGIEQVALSTDSVYQAIKRFLTTAQ